MYEDEKVQILRDLQNRVDKVVGLQMELNEAKEQYRMLESSLTQGDKALKKNTAKLERNLEQITLMYHQVVSEKSVLKVDLQVAEKKIARKEEKVSQLERGMTQLMDQNKKLKAILNAAKNAQVVLTRGNGEGVCISKIGGGGSLTGIPSNARIVKPIRGGRSSTINTPRGLSRAQD